MSDVTFGMTYDGPPDDNPFKPRTGDQVAVCPHEPRPIHLQFMELSGRPLIDGVAVRWINCCRDCRSKTITTGWRLMVWE